MTTYFLNRVWVRLKKYGINLDSYIQGQLAVMNNIYLNTVMTVEKDKATRIVPLEYIICQTIVVKYF